MGIQINGNTDTITAIDGALIVSGAELSAVTNLNATGIVTASGFVGNITGNLNSIGVSTFASGSASAPSITPTGDSNTGIFFPSADTIAFAEGGVEALRIDSNANIGIGTITTLGKFSIQTSSNTSLSVRDSISVTGSSGILLENWSNPTAPVGGTIPFSIRASQFQFGTDSGGNFIERLKIDSSGNFKLSTVGTKILNSSGNPILQQTGSILQVVHTQKTNSFSGTSTQTGSGFYIDVTGLSATITPTSTNSKILILTNMYIGKTTASASYQQHFRIKRNGTAIILGDGEGGRPTSTGRINMYSSDTTSGQYQMTMFSGVHYDSPSSTSALTYQIALGGYSGSPIVYVNRSETWQINPDYDSTPVSTLTLMEVSA